MLDLRFATRATASFHRRFMDDGLPEELTSSAYAAFDRSAYDELLLARGRDAWRGATLNEYRSLAAFTDLLADLTRIGFPFDVISTGTRIVRDEVRHVELCRRMVEALGGDSVIDGEPRWASPDPRTPPLERLLQGIVGSLCIGETASVRMLSLAREVTVDALAKSTLTCLVADESVHSRFGWTVLELMRPSLGEDDVGVLLDVLPGWFGATELAMVGVDPARLGAEPHVATGSSTPFGTVDRNERAQVFYDTFDHDVLARFEALDIPARSAWDARPRRVSDA